jgi:NAD(P)-dependent dehydrogenase (short-subunit alcohol dehydrogenase family)
LGDPQSLASRTILVTGGTSGTGLAGAIAWHSLGAQILLGARSRQRYEEVAAKFGGERLHPMIADLEERSSIEAGVRQLELDGIRPTDIVHCAAAGLEPILRPLMRSVVGLRRLPPGPDRDEAIERERKQLGRLVREHSGTATRVNFEGSRDAMSRLATSLPEGAQVIALSSMWSAGLRVGACPAFYRAVAESKVQFEDWLETQAPVWAGRGTSATVLVGHIISDTGSGKLIDRHVVPLMAEADQLRFRADYVTTAETTQALTRLLIERPQPGAMRRVYLTGTGGLLDSKPDEAIAVAGRVPL